MNLKDTYNKIAEDWHKQHQADDWWIEGTDKFVSFLKPGAEVLDVGCGGGFKSKYLIGKGLKVVGIDFSENIIKIAKREVPKAEFFVMDMRDLKDLHQFDGIFAQASLLHIPKKEITDVLSGLVAKLKIGGYIYVAVKGTQPGKPDEGILEENDLGYSYQRFFSYFTMAELKEHFKNLNLSIVYSETKKFGKTDWLQIIGKKSS
jgi:2-polyprenyl-3-methyl-5-hydroxy-6-metoxy-1,4-benzoquinol methylase